MLLTRAKRCHHIPKDSIIHCYRHENIKSDIVVLYVRLIIDTLTKQRLVVYNSMATDTTMEVPLQETLFPVRREVRIAIIRVTKIGKLGVTFGVTFAVTSDCIPKLAPP
jgi:hypothetical protein